MQVLQARVTCKCKQMGLLLCILVQIDSYSSVCKGGRLFMCFGIIQ